MYLQINTEARIFKPESQSTSPQSADPLKEICISMLYLCGHLSMFAVSGQSKFLEGGRFSCQQRNVISENIRKEFI